MPTDPEVRPPEAFAWREACAIPWTADADVLQALAGIGRTEDVHLSPDNRRLALVGHLHDRLLVLGVRWTPEIHLHSPQPFESPALAYPHGAFWIDNRTLMVANRQGGAPIFRIPDPSPAATVLVLDPVASLEAGSAASAVHSPGSVSVTALPGDLLDVLLCNNYAHHVSRWLLDARAGVVPLASTRLLAEGLRIPDGVAQSRDARWIAVSNHDDHSVYVYDSRDEPGEKSRPNAVLRGLNYPHGLRWTADAQVLLVADAGLPFVHIYERRTSRWEGEYLPAVSLKVLDDDRFMKGHYDPQEGGPKGLDLTSDHQTLVTTTLELPLAFFDLGPMLGTRPERDPQVDIFGSRLAGPVRLMADRIRDADARLLDQQRQLKEMQEAHALAMSEAQQRLADRMNDIKALRQTVERQQQHIVEVSRSYSWRVTAPYRALRRGMSALATRWSGKRALTP